MFNSSTFFRVHFLSFPLKLMSMRSSDFWTTKNTRQLFTFFGTMCCNGLFVFAFIHGWYSYSGSITTI